MGKRQTAELGPPLLFHINIPLGEFFHHVLLLPPTTQRQRLEITKGKHLHTTKQNGFTQPGLLMVPARSSIKVLSCLDILHPSHAEIGKSTLKDTASLSVFRGVLKPLLGDNCAQCNKLHFDYLKSATLGY